MYLLFKLCIYKINNIQTHHIIIIEAMLSKVQQWTIINIWYHNSNLHLNSNLNPTKILLIKHTKINNYSLMMKSQWNLYFLFRLLVSIWEKKSKCKIKDLKRCVLVISLNQQLIEILIKSMTRKRNNNKSILLISNSNNKFFRISSNINN